MRLVISFCDGIHARNEALLDKGHAEYRGELRKEVFGDVERTERADVVLPGHNFREKARHGNVAQQLLERARRRASDELRHQLEARVAHTSMHAHTVHVHDKLEQVSRALFDEGLGERLGFLGRRCRSFFLRRKGRGECVAPAREGRENVVGHVEQFRDRSGSFQTAAHARLSASLGSTSGEALASTRAAAALAWIAGLVRQL